MLVPSLNERVGLPRPGLTQSTGAGRSAPQPQLTKPGSETGPSKPGPATSSGMPISNVVTTGGAANPAKYPKHLLKPEVVLSDPEAARHLALLLGLDQTHQLAAQKASHILRCGMCGEVGRHATARLVNGHDHVNRYDYTNTNKECPSCLFEVYDTCRRAILLPDARSTPQL